MELLGSLTLKGFQEVFQNRFALQQLVSKTIWCLVSISNLKYQCYKMTLIFPGSKFPCVDNKNFKKFLSEKQNEIFVIPNVFHFF